MTDKNKLVAVSKGKLPQQLNETQLKFLDQKTPPAFIRARKGRGGKTFDYVEVGYVIAKLNQIFGTLGWSFESEVVEALTSKTEITVKGTLTVRTFLNGKEFYTKKEQYGGSAIKMSRGAPMSISDDAKGAASDALKKCASKLGIAFDVYHPGTITTSNMLLKKLEDREAREVSRREARKEKMATTDEEVGKLKLLAQKYGAQAGKEKAFIMAELQMPSLTWKSLTSTGITVLSTQLMSKFVKA